MFVKARNLNRLEILNGGHLDKSLMKAIDRATKLQHLVLGAGVAISYENLVMILRLCPQLDTVELRSVIIKSPPAYPWLSDENLNIRSFSMTIAEPQHSMRHGSDRWLMVRAILSQPDFEELIADTD